MPEVTLSWSDSSSYWVTGYEIMRSTNGVSYSAIASVSEVTTSYVDKTVSAGSKTYWYEVEAMSAEGNTDSAAVKVVTEALCL